MPASSKSSRMHVGALAIGGRCGCMWACKCWGAVRAVGGSCTMLCMRVSEGTTGAPRWEWITMYTGRASAKLRRQGCQERPPTRKERPGRPHLGHAPLHFILALNRPSQALPEPPRHCTSWLARHGLPLFHETLLSRERPSDLPAGLSLPCTRAICCHHAHEARQRISFLLRS